MLNILSEYLIKCFVPKLRIVNDLGGLTCIFFYIIEDILAQARALYAKVVLGAQLRLLPRVSVPLHVGLPISCRLDFKSRCFQAQRS